MRLGADSLIVLDPREGEMEYSEYSPGQWWWTGGGCADELPEWGVCWSADYQILANPDGAFTWRVRYSYDDTVGTTSWPPTGCETTDEGDAVRAD